MTELSATQRRVLDEIAGGAPRKLAAKRAGISPRTIEQWHRRYGWWREAEDQAKNGKPATATTDTEPVSIREFITSPDYLNAAGAVYPVVLDECERIVAGNHREVLLVGGIGSGKSTSAVLCMCYHIYVLSCMSEPQSSYGLSPDQSLTFVLQTRTERSAKHTAYALMRAMIARSPYFQRAFPFDPRLKSRMVFPKGLVVEPFSGDPLATLGHTVVSGLLDEANFLGVTAKSVKAIDAEPYDVAVEAYDALVQRMKSRFPSGGWRLFVASSRRYEGQFSDSIERRAEHDDSIYVYDKRIWDIRPAEFADRPWFKVFVGGRGQTSRILRDNEQADGRVISVPETFRPEFERNLHRALQNIAGVSCAPIGAYFNDPGAIRRAMTHRNDKFLRAADVDNPGALLRRRFEAPWSDAPRVVSIDPSVKRDLTGIAAAHVDHYDGQGRPHIVVDLVARIHPPVGGEISLRGIEQIPRDLVSGGLPVQYVSTDQYQATMMRQNLADAFTTYHVSVDQTRPNAPMLAWETLKEAINESRVSLPDDEQLLDELAHLQVDWERRRVDHLPRKRKDSADAVAAAVYVLSNLSPRVLGHDVDRPLRQLHSRVTIVESETGSNLFGFPSRDDGPFGRGVETIDAWGPGSTDSAWERPSWP
ncbi:MAG TPA: hypothetical protein VMR74_08550 [Gammaproteobacteria bacterium]|nr:hypothetical protein [Gammaproteobacteria bacterium]